MAIRIGIAGFGNHALGRILPAIEAHHELSLAGVWTRSVATRAALETRGFNGITADFKQFLAEPKDIVYVASPTGLHFEHAAAILQAGHHAWVEKPLATNLADVQKLLAIAESGNRMLCEAFMFPWHAQAEVIRQALEQQTIGKLRHVSLTFCFPHLAPQNFRYVAELGGGAYLDHACYLVKALDVYLGGTWTVLGGCIDNYQYAVDVAGAAQLRRDTDGVIANLNWGFGSTYINEMQFVGERGRLLVESAFTKPASRSCDVVLEDGQGRRSTLAVTREDPYTRMIEGFVQQFATPSTWQGIREEILRHARHFHELRAWLKQCS